MGTGLNGFVPQSPCSIHLVEGWKKKGGSREEGQKQDTRVEERDEVQEGFSLHPFWFHLELPTHGSEERPD